MYRTVFLLLALALLATASPTVYFIRHGEKPRNGGTGLSADGLERAECIRQVFGEGSKYAIGYILAQRPKDNGKRARPYETVQPLAADLGITVDIECDRDDSQCVKDKIDQYSGHGNVLICWEHRRMTHIAEELGDEDAPTYPDDRFDLIWTYPSPYTEVTEITREKCHHLEMLGKQAVGMQQRILKGSRRQQI
ncbi:uncharacterized protein N7459_006384 [Penicillium hispanicum]|uniref:uncharacterized protein n=1 Tax=Penicillium hispanicum TaxID=1080232 RepID=UPI00253F8047|nr:uncharacterized protein N7459_006384 [Penicillium hispanicum]KAJ5577420.1 hypothetical protein N7459_006384 [Penicillium hispanicum]